MDHSRRGWNEPQNKTLTLGNEEYKYEQMSLPVQPEEPGMVAMYAANVVQIKP